MKRYLIILIAIFNIQSGFSKVPLIISSIKGSINSIIATKIMKEAYARIGFKIRVKPFPGERALSLSNSGEVDGELFRIKNIHITKYKNLIMIPVPINRLIGRAYTIKYTNLKIKSVTSLKKYRIGIMIGTKFTENFTQEIKTQKLKTNAQLFKMLSADRLDFVLTAELNGIKKITELNLKDITQIDPPFITKNLYHYVHKKHAYLVPKLTSTLKEMEVNGYFLKIRNHVVTELLNQTNPQKKSKPH